jgi:hypothetical protein
LSKWVTGKDKSPLARIWAISVGDILLIIFLRYALSCGKLGPGF